MPIFYATDAHAATRNSDAYKRKQEEKRRESPEFIVDRIIATLVVPATEKGEMEATHLWRFTRPEDAGPGAPCALKAFLGDEVRGALVTKATPSVTQQGEAVLALLRRIGYAAELDATRLHLSWEHAEDED